MEFLAQRFDFDKEQLSSAIATVLIHLAFFMLLIGALGMKEDSAEEARFIKLRLGASDGVQDKSFAKESEAVLQKIEKKLLPEIGAVEEDEVPREVLSEQVVAKNPVQKERRSNDVAGSEFGNSDEGQKAATYLELLQLTVQETSQIPSIAREERISGNAVLRLTFNRSGYVIKFKLVQKTGSEILDDAALAVGQQLSRQPFPPMPRDFEAGKGAATYDFPVSFNP